MRDGAELSDGLQLILLEPSFRQDAIGFLANSPILAVNHVFSEGAVWQFHAQQIPERIIMIGRNIAGFRVSLREELAVGGTGLPPLVLAARMIERKVTTQSLIGSPLRPVSSNAGFAGAGPNWVRPSAPAAGDGKETVLPNY